MAELLVDPRAQALTLPAPTKRRVPCSEHTGMDLGRTWFKKLHNSKTNMYKYSGVSNHAPAALGQAGPQPTASKRLPGSVGAWTQVSVTAELLVMLMALSCCPGASQYGAPCSHPHPWSAAAATCQHTRLPSAAAPRACREGGGMLSSELAPEPGRGSPPPVLSLCLPPSLHDVPILKHQDLVCTHHSGEPAEKSGCYPDLAGRGFLRVCTVPGDAIPGALTS